MGLTDPFVPLFKGVFSLVPTQEEERLVGGCLSPIAMGKRPTPRENRTSPCARVMG